MTTKTDIQLKPETGPSARCSPNQFAKLPLALALLAIAPAAGAQPQPPPPAASAPPAPPPNIIYATAAEAEALIEKAKSERKEGQNVGPLQPLVRIPGYRALVEYRTGPTPASVHDKNAEFIYVIGGSGTLITGGTLNDAKHTNSVNQRGTGITGGTTRSLARGDSIFLPPGMPHFFSGVGAEGLSVIALHIPPNAPVAAP